MSANRKHRSWSRLLVLGLTALGTVGVAIWTKAQAQVEMPATLPTVGFSSSSYTVSEGETVNITVTLSQSSTSTVTVNVEATATDYFGDPLEHNDTIQFNSGETSKTFQFTFLYDPCCQGNTTVSMNLSNPSGATLGVVSSATLTALDIDQCP
jgi:cytoskeletal protein RodZ